MLLVSFLIKMKVRSQQYWEQMSAGPRGCAKSKEEEPKCVLLLLPLHRWLCNTHPTVAL